MTSSFKQCAAIKPDGQRCQRIAKEGDYCHSHRHYRPKEHCPVPGEGPLIRVSELDISVSYSAVVDICAGCGEILDLNTERLLCTDGKVFCTKCGLFQYRIETRIAEICSCPGGLPARKIIEDLERFGIPPEMTETARQRMLKEGRLINS